MATVFGSVRSGAQAVSGALTFCGRPAAGFFVVAFEISRIGIEDPETAAMDRLGVFAPVQR